MTRIVAAPNALKGSLDAVAAARAMAQGVRQAAPEADVVELAVADGGDGTREVLSRALGGTNFELEVQDALGRPLRAVWSRLPDGTGLVDVASASGLARLAAGERDALRASSFGTGQLLRAALDAGCTSIVLGVGGSASVDGGAGLLEALGVRFLDEGGGSLPPGGASLGRLSRLDRTTLHPALGQCAITVACDVSSPLLGPGGAARLYGPQKGATPEQVDRLERALTHYADVLQRETGLDVRQLDRAGAAGGVAAGLHAVLGARLESGIDLVLDRLEFDQRVQGAELVITAEGRLDEQSTRHKGPWGVAERAARFGVPTVALAGSISRALRSSDLRRFAGVFPIGSGPVELEAALRAAADDLCASAAQVTRLFLAARGP